MPRVLLPTIDAPPARGGVARYIGAITATFPESVTLAQLPWPVSFWELFALLQGRGREFDRIWVHHIFPVGTVAYLCRKLLQGKPYVLFLHGLDFDLARRSAWRRMLAQRLLRGAQYVVTNSRALAREVAHFAGVPEPLVVYPCVADKFVEIAEEKFGRPTDGATNANLRLLTVARLVERKGHMKVLEALRHLPGVTYHIVGDGPMRDALRQKITELNLHDRVTLETGVSDRELPNAYAAADVFVMPTTKTNSDREGFGTVYLEANLFGLPVVATGHPGVDEAVVDGETGVLIDDTPDALLAALATLERDRARCRRLGAQGRERVLRDFVRGAQFAKLKRLL